MTTQSLFLQHVLMTHFLPYFFTFYFHFLASVTDFSEAHVFKGRSVSFLFPPALYLPRWSDRGSTDPSISRCLDSLPPVHHRADPRPPSRSLHLPGGCCRCCSPPRPGEGPTGVFLFHFFLSIHSHSASQTFSMIYLLWNISSAQNPVQYIFSR